MFYGVVQSEAQAVMNKIVKGWDVKDIYVGCSGNFTIEKFLGLSDRYAIHSNDVSLYSMCLGKFFAGESVPLELSEEGEEKLGWLVRDYMKTDVEKLATVMLSLRLVSYMSQDNEYYRMMWKEYTEQFPELHAKTVEKFEKNRVRIKEYMSCDYLEFVKTAPAECGFVSFPPFKTAGRAAVKDVEKLESIFKYDAPEYTRLDESRLMDYFREVMKKEAWCFGTDLKLEGEEFLPYMRGMTKTVNRGVPVYIYACDGKTQIVTPNQSTMQVNVPRFSQGMEMGDDIRLNILSEDAFRSLRSQYLNANISPGSASIAMAVTVDGYLVGCFAFSSSPNLTSWDTHIETPTIYLMTDFPVAPVDYKNLAKLVVCAALSKESKLIAERITRKRCVSLVTTAFSKNPESMKYRGLLKLLGRRENDLGAKASDSGATSETINFPYALNYGAPMGQWTLKEGLALWKKKYAQKRAIGE